MLLDDDAYLDEDLGGEFEDLIEADDGSGEEYREKSADDFLLFVDGLYIPTPQPTLFSTCMAPFQREFFRSIGPTLVALRDGDVPPRRRYWVERTKKSAKDSDVAICLLWLMAFPRRPLLCPVSAANQEQAGIIKKRAKDILFFNPWLAGRVSVQQNRIVGYGGVGEVKIEATGKATAKHGDTPDLLVLNELVHVDNWGVNQTHMNNANGCPRGVVIVCTNAGIKGTPAEAWRRKAKAERNATPFDSDRRWTFMQWEGKAPWVNDEDVEEARSQDPVGSEFARLWKGQWVSGVGAAVDDSAIERCFTMPGPWRRRKPGWECTAGLDLGVSHDHAGLVVLASSKRRQLVKTACVKGWAPSVPNDRGVKEVDIEEVERACLQFHRLFLPTTFWYDPAAGGSFLAQRFRRRGLPMREMSFSTPSNLDDMARSFVQVMKAGKLRCYDDGEGRLRRDFGKFNIEVRVPTGYRLRAVSDEYGHADVGTGLLIALPRAVEILGGWGRLLPNDPLVDGGEDELTKEEVEKMPRELRDIMGVYDEIERGARRRRR